MKKILLLLLFFLAIVPDAHGQLFGRGRGRYIPDCPNGECNPSTGGSVGPVQDDVPEWAVKATCEVHAGNAGGTGGIFHYDKEAKKCYILTCRHVISRQTQPCYVKLYDGIKREATFLGYSQSSDLALLEIDSDGVETFVELFDGDIYTGQEVYQVGYGINASRVGSVNKRRGKVIKPSGYVGENSYDVSFMLISGDSGSPIFDAKTKTLMGVGWGHDYRHGKITGPKDCREFVLSCLRRRGKQPPKQNPGGGIKHEKPAEPVKPTEPIRQEEPQKQPGCDCPKDKPAKPVEPPCKCPPPADQKTVTDALAKLTEVATLTNQSVQGLTVKVEGVDKRVGEIDKRLSVVEKKQAEPPPAQKPPEVDPRIGQIQNDLDKLRAALKRGGTLNVTITPQ